MGAVSNDFYRQVLEQIHAPITTENMKACHAWQAAEGGNASSNPFNTTQPEPGDSNYNSFGPHGTYHVRNYRSEQSGVKATVSTLLNGHYPQIIDAFRHGNDGLAVCSAVDSSVWGTSGAHTVYLQLYGNHPAPVVHRVLHTGMVGSDVRQVQERLQHYGFYLGFTCDGDYGPHTVRAVEAFQVSRHLQADGVVGPITRRALGLPQ